MRWFQSAAACLVICLLAASSAQATIVFNSWEDNTTGFFAFGAANGSLGLEDYVAEPQAVGDVFTIENFRFVGGVDTVGGIIDVTFFDESSNPVDGFAVQLPSAGNFIWNIGLGAGFAIPDTGFVDITVDATRPENAGVLGQWFITENGVSVGSSPLDPSSLGTGFNFAFELDGTIVAVPEPSSAFVFASFAFCGLVRSRRRRLS